MEHHCDSRKEKTMLLTLKMALFQQGKRQTRMALDLGLDPARLSRIVNELAVPNPEERKGIAQYLGVAEEELFGRTPQHGNYGRHIARGHEAR
jgi:transcriptional regulator with XRE-family HTH domain